MKIISRGLLLPLAGFLLLQGCENPTLIGLEDQQFANGTVIDTVSILTETVLVPRTRTDNNLITRDISGSAFIPINYRAVGNFNDPEFGATDASAFTQLFINGGHFRDCHLLSLEHSKT